MKIWKAFFKKSFHCGKHQYQSDYYAKYKARLDRKKDIDDKIAKEKQLAIEAIDKDINVRLDSAAGFDLVSRMLDRCSRWWIGGAISANQYKG